MRWDPLQQQFLVYRGGDDGSKTTVNQMYSPEEAARRARVMSQAENIYAKQSGRSFDQAAYDQAMKAWWDSGPKIMGQRSSQTPGTPPPDPNQFWKETGTGATGAYPGAVPVGASADTLAAQERLRAFSTGQGQQIANNAVSALNFGLGDVLYPGSNPALQATIDTATRKVGEAYTDPGGVMSQIRSNFISGAPAGGSSREGIAMGIAGRNYLNTIGDVTGALASRGYETGLSHVGRTMGMAPNMYNLATQPAVTQGAVGAQGEQYQQAQENYMGESRNWALNAPWQPLQQYANIVYGGGGTQQTSTTPGVGIQPVQRAGMATGGAALGYQMTGGNPYGAAAGAAIGLLMSYV